MAQSFLDSLQNLKILNQLIEIYYKSTGMVISFHYPGKNGRISFYPQEENSEYCQPGRYIYLQKTSAPFSSVYPDAPFAATWQGSG